MKLERQYHSELGRNLGRRIPTRGVGMAGDRAGRQSVYLLDQAGVVRFLLEAVGQVAWSDAGSDFVTSNGRFRPQMLLSVLAYSYTIGLVESAEIEYESKREPVLRYLCANSYPDAQTLRQFRRQNRAPLKVVLTALLESLWRDGIRAETPNATDPVDGVMHEEAESRIQRAVQRDSMALDF